jgi:acyl-CoA synthetase (NDP forming)
VIDTARPALYSHADLNPLIAPRTIAIVGASPRKGSFGANVLENCSDYDGQIYLVNPAYEDVAGVRCYPSLSALPCVPDCAVITVKRELVENVITECAELGIRGAIVFASGFSETSKSERKAEQDRLVEIARRGGVRIAGPNTVGSSNFVNGAVLTFSPEMLARRPAPQGAIGVASQSGAVGYALAQGMHHGANISHLLVCGNSSDVDVADYVAYLADEESCAAIVCLVEGMDDPQRLVMATKRARDAGKPLIMFKAARGEIGASAALSHTGSIAGSHASYVAALEAAGAIFIDDHDALLDTASFLAKAPPPRSDGVAILTASGGWGIILADIAEEFGLELPALPDRAKASLLSIIPEFGNAANPCDVTAQILANRESLSQSAGALLGEDCYGLLVWPQVWTTSGNRAGYETMIAAVDEVADAHAKMACMIWGTQWLEGPAVASGERLKNVAVFRSTRHCFNAISIWQSRASTQSIAKSASQPLIGAAAHTRARSMLERCGQIVGERTAKAILAECGVQVVAERTARTPEEAADLAASLGFPVVLKVESPDLPHKSEAGAVRLNLQSREDVIKEGRAALESVSAHSPAARIDHLLVQPMVSQGVEIIVGTKFDPLFGPMVAVGIGGILVEFVRDVSLRPAPVSVEEAVAMIDALRSRRILNGVRNLPKVNVERLAETVARVSELAAANADLIAEIDVNPLICVGSDIIAADALIVRR